LNFIVEACLVSPSEKPEPRHHRGRSVARLAKALCGQLLAFGHRRLCAKWHSAV